jgi:ParB/RepB/Spo0J family partition protein
MKLREHDAITSKSDMFRVDPRALVIDPGFNVRNLDSPDAREALDALKASIKVEGVQVALEVRLIDDKLIVVSGHRRHRAVMELIAEGNDIATVPAVAEPRSINDAERTARLITLNSGEPLSALEKAEVIRRLLNFGWSREKIQARFGYKSVQTINNYELLLSAPAIVHDAVSNGEISASEATAMVRAHGPVGTTKAFQAARATATANGKTKITKATVVPRTTPLSEPGKPRYGAMLDTALSALTNVVANGYGARAMADAYIAQSSATISELLDWLIVFQDALREKEESKQRPIMIIETVESIAVDETVGNESAF